MDPSHCAIGHRLPPHSRVIESRRDFLVIRLAKFASAQNIGILWDPSRDELVLDVITALTYRDGLVRNKIVALAMFRGNLSAYYAGTDNLEWAREQIQAAADSVLSLINQRWEVLAPIPVPLLDGFMLDWSKLASDHPLRVIPTKYQLGQVNP